MIHLTFLIRQLTCPVAGSSIDNDWRHYLRIAGFARLVEEEVDECALQARSLSDVDGETGTGDLNAEIEVYQVIFFR